MFFFLFFPLLLSYMFADGELKFIILLWKANPVLKTNIYEQIELLLNDYMSYCSVYMSVLTQRSFRL